MSELYLGLISGTSRDGIEAALAVARGPIGWEVRAHRHHPYPDAVATELTRLTLAARAGYRELGELDAKIGEVFAEAAIALLREASVSREQVRAIGSHGQTLHHAPDASPAFTWQIGDPFRIAERTGIDTVALFRHRDIAAGGEGAPLACGLHAACFSHDTRARAVVNIGGISNITWLRPGQPVLGYDCGPGNTLLDAWIRRHRGLLFDAGGRWAAEGRTHPELLKGLREDPFFAAPPPKTTGPEYFSPDWLAARLARLGPLAPADVQATLTELTASTIADAVHAGRPRERASEVLICGGGVRNATLVRQLQHRLGDIPVTETGALGLPAEQVEAAAFAWLARQTIGARAGNLPEVTGASGPRILGCVIPGRTPPPVAVR
ncbi:Anhydro-N-acetylmuramic acid kinase [Thioalkalivibrio nitratireducens DSM 14787]|uniref:Anhydro-N-acetylmuramic acid kinase n=1 Tax=Thioalkalivibrio nitratireducens (strain DSM 14787 / UNIQEM 213 / ALEN2) TaxID=1255043 RepID=L0E1J7_THIND|nr:anhydro-N-acetylmuramic acid kinase [Thioalkalivibrio nitratireducens]AGA35080.1 Anhydro-N-acetylmuramic acid kinase [Thioalkalivibrio nitratireducens DSM 14787]